MDIAIKCFNLFRPTPNPHAILVRSEQVKMSKSQPIGYLNLFFLPSLWFICFVTGANSPITLGLFGYLALTVVGCG